MTNFGGWVWTVESCLTSGDRGLREIVCGGKGVVLVRRLREVRGASFNLRDLNARLSGTANAGSDGESDALGI